MIESATFFTDNTVILAFTDGSTLTKKTDRSIMVANPPSTTFIFGNGGVLIVDSKGIRYEEV